MATHHLGDLLVHFRKQLGLTQQDLAIGTIDAATISKYESGKLKPSRKTVEAIFERFGLSLDSVITFFLTEKEIKLDKLADEMNVHMSLRNNEETALLIKRLRSEPSFMNERLNRQHILFAEAQLAVNTETYNTKVLDTLKEAIELAHKDFSIEKISTSFLTTMDTRILTMMAIQEFEIGDKQKAVEILRSLKANMETKCIDETEMGRRYPHVIVTLANMLLHFGEHEEIIKICIEGRAVCKRTAAMWFLPSLAQYEGFARAEMGETETAKSLLTSAFHTYTLHEKYQDRNYMVKEAKKKYKITIK